MWTHNTGVVSSDPTRVTIKRAMVSNATGNYLMKSTSPGKTQSLSLITAFHVLKRLPCVKIVTPLPLVSATLEIEYATQIF